MSQLKPIHTRQLLLESAVDEFLEHGYRGASVRKICAGAGASSNAITYHFGSKERLYREVLSRFAALQSGHTEAALAREPKSQQEFEVRLEVFLERLLQAYFANRKTLLIVLREFEQFSAERDDSVFRKLIENVDTVSEYILKAKKQGFVREDVDAGIAAGTLLDRLLNQARFAHTHKFFYGVTSLDPDYRAHWVRETLSLVLNGISPRPSSTSKI